MVAETVNASGCIVLAHFDDDVRLQGSHYRDAPILPYDLNYQSSIPLILAFGDNELRKKLQTQVAHSFGLVAHPSAQIAYGVTIGEGSQVLAGVIINVEASIGKHTILNSGCIIEHHVTVGDYVHLTPGAVLCGACSIGDGTTVGPNVTVVKGKKVGKGCVLAAGTVVVDDVPDNSRVQGVPGKITPLVETKWDWS